MRPSMRFLSTVPICALLLSWNALPCPGAERDQADRGPASEQRAVLAFDLDGGNEATVALHGEDARWQLQINGPNESGEIADFTRQTHFVVEPPIAQVSSDGYLRPLENGTATIIATVAAASPPATAEPGQSSRPEKSISIPLNVTGLEVTQSVSFANQIVPIFTKLGCNGGGCHGKSSGQAGFKLSLLGFEPSEDYHHLVNESRGRRVFPAFPDRSLLLRKAINAEPHGGGQRLDIDSHEYRLLRRWIANGMPYGSQDDPVVERIAVFPPHRRLQRQSSQQLRVMAYYSDGRQEDITRTAQFESNNKDLATVNETGLVQIGDFTGDAAVMARYQGLIAVFGASIPLGVDLPDSLVWPERRNYIDDLVFEKLEVLGIPPSDLCSDATFVRRVTLDLAGRLPTAEESQEFLSSQAEDKHQVIVRRLLESTDHAEYFARKWTAILRNRRQSPGHQFGTFAFHNWLVESFHQNKPFDQFVREIVAASGSLRTNPPVAWLREVANTESRVEDAAQLFLGQRLQCARCHHHPFEKWSQKDYYQMAAFFSKLRKKEGDVPEEPIFTSRVGGSSSRHPRTGETLKPAGLSQPPLDVADDADPRHMLVDWMVQPENPFFSKALVNRYWKHFFSVGFVEPEDDMRISNPPTNPVLLDRLADEFVASGFDLRELMFTICTSTTYRLDSEPNDFNLGDQNGYSRFYPKRLTSEVLLDAVDQVTLTHSQFAGLPKGYRAVALPDTSYRSYFLDVFGQPDSETACECERSQEATLAQSLHLLNSKEIQQKLADAEGRVAAASSSSQVPAELIEQIYLAAFARRPTPEELDVARAYLAESETDDRPHSREALEDLVWAIINTKEFLFNH